MYPLKRILHVKCKFSFKLIRAKLHCMYFSNNTDNNSMKYQQEHKQHLNTSFDVYEAVKRVYKIKLLLNHNFTSKYLCFLTKYIKQKKTDRIVSSRSCQYNKT